MKDKDKDREEVEWLLELIDDKLKEDEIVFLTVEGFKTCKIEDMLKQSPNGILYDLNRDLAVLKTLVNPKENNWCVNDIALAILFKRVLEKLKEYENKDKIN